MCSEDRGGGGNEDEDKSTPRGGGTAERRRYSERFLRISSKEEILEGFSDGRGLEEKEKGLRGEGWG